MMNLACGANKVANVEMALAGKRPPLALMKKMSNELFRKRLLEINRRTAARDEFKPLLREQAEAVLGKTGALGLTPSARRAYKDISNKIRLRSKARKRSVPKLPKVESRVDAGSLSWVKAAPYDFSWTSASGIFQTATADAVGGNCQATVFGQMYKPYGGGNSYAAIGTLFFANQSSHSALFSAFTWRDWELDTNAGFFFEDAHAEYQIFLDVLETTGVDAGTWIVNQTLISQSMDSYSFSTGHNEDAMHQSFGASFPINQGWYQVWIGVGANANTDCIAASSSINLSVPFISMLLR